MEETNNQTASSETPAKQPNPKSKPLIATSIIASVAAIAGIATGIYFYLDANNKAADNADLQAKIDLLESENGTEPTVGIQGDTGNITTNEPVIYSIIQDTDDIHFSQNVFTKVYPTDQILVDAPVYQMRATAADGNLECSIYQYNDDAEGEKIQDCDLSNHQGKVVDLVDGHMGNGLVNRIMLLTNQGEVEYIDGFGDNYGVLQKLELPQKVIRIYGDNKVGGIPKMDNGELAPYGGGTYVLVQYIDVTIESLHKYFQ